MSNVKHELYFEHLKGQAQFAYFQLGLTASAIAFAIHETQDVSLADAPWPVAGAVTLWAISFVAGSFGVAAHQAAMRTNLRYLELSDEIGPLRQRPDVDAALTEARNTVQQDLDRPMIRFRQQLWTLFAGGLFYIAGHLMHMSSLPRHGG